MSDIRNKKKITSEYRKLWYYEMLYGTLKYHEPPIRLAKYEIDSHIFMHREEYSKKSNRISYNFSN
jgi:hypothetical protein